MDAKFLNSFVFSYLIADCREIPAILKNSFKEELDGEAVQLTTSFAKLNQLIDYDDLKPVLPGGIGEHKAIFYQPKGCKNKTIMISNVGDGWHGLQNRISKRLNCSAYQFRLESLSLPEPMNSLSYSSPSKIDERVVYSIKEGGRWTFCSVGSPLPFEKEEYYRNRMIKKRMNPAILKEYLIKLGLPAEAPAFFEVEKDTNVVFFKRMVPNPYTPKPVISDGFYENLKFADETAK